MLLSTFNLKRFEDAHNEYYSKAFIEIKNAKKETHWMWFIFPQIQGLGYSSMSVYYAIKNQQEAIAYLLHPILSSHLIEITQEVLRLKQKNPQINAFEIFGEIDAIKFKSSLTLFSEVVKQNQEFHQDLKFQIFQQIIDLYFQGQSDLTTLNLLKA
jgi:uncharacterized protein (DUF1810 family)